MPWFLERGWPHHKVVDKTQLFRSARRFGALGLSFFGVFHDSGLLDFCLEISSQITTALKRLLDFLSAPCVIASWLFSMSGLALFLNCRLHPFNLFAVGAVRRCVLRKHTGSYIGQRKRSLWAVRLHFTVQLAPLDVFYLQDYARSKLSTCSQYHQRFKGVLNEVMKRIVSCLLVAIYARLDDQPTASIFCSLQLKLVWKNFNHW